MARKTIYSWLLIQEKTGGLEPQTGFQKGHSHAIKDLEKFKKFVDERTDYAHDEMAEHFSVGHATIGRMLKKIGYVVVVTRYRQNFKNKENSLRFYLLRLLAITSTTRSIILYAHDYLPLRSH